MNVKHVRRDLVFAVPLVVMAAPSALAEAAAANAGLNHELWWLALALLVGFSVVARRASHQTTDASAAPGPEGAEPAPAQTPIRDRLRLINKTVPEPRAEASHQPSLDMPPKKTA